MKIICTQEERNNLMEVITAGCCWIGNGYGEGGKRKKANLEKFKMDLHKVKPMINEIFDFEKSIIDHTNQDLQSQLYQENLSSMVLFLLLS